ncbi:MAG: hypothetical protein NC310_02350 [Roseburia sp.]|nr:hypothetical protein [Anaeroplasma bactoclasticum]MCM1195897.1 hypothetical protein [Roseburia sp.]MCM1556242.1 hypothetical protein [Anaeroplasma bactoclasticum]
MKKIVLIIFIFFALIETSSCTQISEISRLNEDFDLNLPNLNLLYYNSPRSSFRGDGVYYYVFQVEEGQKTELFNNDWKTDRALEKYIKDDYRFVLNEYRNEPVPEEFLLDFELPYSYFYKTSGDGPFKCKFDETIEYREISYFLYFESSETLHVVRVRI